MVSSFCLFLGIFEGSRCCFVWGFRRLVAGLWRKEGSDGIGGLGGGKGSTEGRSGGCEKVKGGYCMMDVYVGL